MAEEIKKREREIESILSSTMIPLKSKLYKLQGVGYKVPLDRFGMSVQLSKGLLSSSLRTH